MSKIKGNSKRNNASSLSDLFGLTLAKGTPVLSVMEFFGHYYYTSTSVLLVLSLCFLPKISPFKVIAMK